jgi:hypothetical protein
MHYAPRSVLPPLLHALRADVVRTVEATRDEVLQRARDGRAVTRGRPARRDDSEYRQGLKEAFVDAVDRLEQTRSFEAMFLTGRRLRHYAIEAGGQIDFAEHTMQDRAMGLDEGPERHHFSGLDALAGRRDGYGAVVHILQRLFTL